jgi:hypothetical protein
VVGNISGNYECCALGWLLRDHKRHLLQGQISQPNLDHHAHDLFTHSNAHPYLSPTEQRIDQPTLSAPSPLIFSLITHTQIKLISNPPLENITTSNNPYHTPILRVFIPCAGSTCTFTCMRTSALSPRLGPQLGKVSRLTSAAHSCR